MTARKPLPAPDAPAAEADPEGATETAEEQAAAAAEAARLLAAVKAGASGLAAPAPAPVSGDEVEVVMTVAISGLRDGQPWPAVGESITLPAGEAEQYVLNGYAKKAE